MCPIFFNRFPVCSSDASLEVERVESLARRLVGGKMELGDEQDEICLGDLELQVLLHLLHSLPEMDAPLADNIVGKDDMYNSHPLDR